MTSPGYRNFLRALVAVACLMAAGCGHKVYEERLAATQAWYGYLDRLEQNLKGSWRGTTVDEFRVPKNFNEIAAPQPTQNPDGELVMPAVDPRQPDYANVLIDGLIGAWRADVAAVSNDQNVTLPVYLYVASNGPLFLSERVEEAIHFTKNTIAYLETALGTSGRKDGNVDFPQAHLSFGIKKHQFVKSQKFEKQVFNPELPIYNTRYSFEMYSSQQGDNQVVVLLAIPAGMDPSSRISERMQLTLEAMKISDQRPQAQPEGAAGGGQPGPAGGGF